MFHSSTSAIFLVIVVGVLDQLVTPTNESAIEELYSFLSPDARVLHCRLVFFGPPSEKLRRQATAVLRRIVPGELLRQPLLLQPPPAAYG